MSRSKEGVNEIPPPTVAARVAAGPWRRPGSRPAARVGPSAPARSRPARGLAVRIRRCDRRATPNSVAASRETRCRERGNGPEGAGGRQARARLGQVRTPLHLVEDDQAIEFESTSIGSPRRARSADDSRSNRCVGAGCCRMSSRGRGWSCRPDGDRRGLRWDCRPTVPGCCIHERDAATCR